MLESNIQQRTATIRYFDETITAYYAYRDGLEVGATFVHRGTEYPTLNKAKAAINVSRKDFVI